jgi:hypothetical protein
MSRSPTAAARTNENGTTKRPVAEFKYGLCRASVWENEKDGGGVRYSVSCQRSYKDDQGWHQTQTLNASDIDLMIMALEDAKRWVYGPKQQGESEPAGAERPIHF